MIELVNVVHDFIANNSIELLAACFTILAAAIPIPVMFKKILEELNQANKTKAELEDAKKKLEELTSNKNEAEGEAQDDTESIGISSQSPKHAFFTYSSKQITLNELYEKRNTDKVLKKISFTLAVIMSIIGTIILFIGILISLFSEKEIGWITTSSGAIIELVAGVYFWLVNRTMKEVKDNSKQLEKTEDLLTAIELAEKITDVTTKDETYKSMIDKLLSKNDK